MKSVYLYAFLVIVLLHAAAKLMALFTTINADQLLLYVMTAAVAYLMAQQETAADTQSALQDGAKP